MNELEVGIISALTGGITGFFASRFSGYLDNRGKITIKPLNHKLEYIGLDESGFTEKYENFNDKVSRIVFSFSLEIRNPSRIRKDYKNGKLIIRTQGMEDEIAALLYYDDNNYFQNAMMEPLEVRISRLTAQLNPVNLKKLQSKKVKFYLSITDSKDVITEALIGFYDNFLNS